MNFWSSWSAEEGALEELVVGVGSGMVEDGVVDEMGDAF